jgi:hypothetical protein
MEAIRSFETSVNFNRTAWYHITKQSTLRDYFRKNLMSYAITEDKLLHYYTDVQKKDLNAGLEETPICIPLGQRDVKQKYWIWNNV